MNKLLSNKTMQSVLWLIGVLLAWELASRSGLVSDFILPPFTKVMGNMIHELIWGNLAMQVFNSMVIILIGFALSIVLALAIGFLCTWLPVTEGLFITLSTIFNPLPGIALMPLIILWFGISTTAMLAIIVHGVLWALVRHILDGFHSIPAVYHDWARNIGLGPWLMFSHVLVFAITPEIIVGLRVGWGRAWRALISAEMIFGMIGTFGGLGYYIYTNRAYANLTNVMAGVVIIIIIGIIVESCLFGWLEKRTLKRWGMFK